VNRSRKKLRHIERGAEGTHSARAHAAKHKVQKLASKKKPGGGEKFSAPEKSEAPKRGSSPSSPRRGERSQRKEHRNQTGAAKRNQKQGKSHQLNSLFLREEKSKQKRRGRKNAHDRKKEGAPHSSLGWISAESEIPGKTREYTNSSTVCRARLERGGETANQRKRKKKGNLLFKMQPKNSTVRTVSPIKIDKRGKEHSYQKCQFLETKAGVNCMGRGGNDTAYGS